jgi:hypothetical protein
MPRTATVHAVTTIGIDMGKNTLHMIGLDSRGAIVLREKISRGRITSRLANPPPCLIGIEAGMATHYVARELTALGHDVITWTRVSETARRLADVAIVLQIEIICGPHWQRMPVTSAPTRPSTAPRRR